jgi:hypothetical protein
MSFLNDLESKAEGVNDTIEFVIRVAIVTLAAVILVVVMALVVGLFVPNELVDSTAILETINPAFQTIIGAFVGLLGGLSLNANARDVEVSGVALDPEPEPQAPALGPIVTDDDDDDDMEPWEKYRNDLRYDHNHDGVVDENDFPDWRNPGQ